MLDPVYSSQFKRDFKLMQKRNEDMDKIRDIMDMLENEVPLKPKHNEHPLQGNYKGCKECHIEPDWLLIYDIDKSENEIYFVRTGTHSDLF